MTARSSSLGGWFEAQVERTPEAVALVYEATRLTYAELNRRANQLAHHLRALGVGPEVKVGVCLERSLEMVVAILGVLKAGGAYVPLDPAYPKERLGFMLEDTGVPVLVTEERLAGPLPASMARLVKLDTDRQAIEAQPADNPPSRARAEHLAYVIYTSGSTGRPKGVEICHAQVLRLFTATEAWFHFGPHDVWSLFHSYAFDVSVWELWGALLHGGRLVVVPSWVCRSPEAFHALLAREQVTVLCQTPSVFQQLSRVEETTGQPAPLALRLIIFAGEALDFRSLRPWFARHGDERPRLINMYGITETTVHSTYRPVSATDSQQAAGSFIGVPIPDLQLHVLSPEGTPVPVGVAGELFVGGAGLGRGYLGRPELTAQRFVPDPFSGQPGARLYRSGDLARWRTDGELEYLGRIDHQVKVRGFRIELQEVELALLETGVVQAAAVTAARDASGDAMLVAWVVPAAPETSDLDSRLRSLLRTKLPEHMVPSRFMTLPELPLTPTGKLDRGALSAKVLPSAAPVDTSEDLSTLAYVTAVMSEMLGVEHVEPRADFFDLGGHSFSAMRVISRLRDRFRVVLNADQLFRARTPEALSQLLDRLLAGGAGRVQSIRRLPREGAFPLSIFQENVLYKNRAVPFDSANHRGLRVQQFQGPLNVGALERAVNIMRRRHEIFRTVLTGTRGDVEQRVLPYREWPLRVIDLSATPFAEQEDAVCALLREDEEHPFNVTEDLWDAYLIRLAPEDHVFVQSLHSVITDPWTRALSEQEISALYQEALGVGPSGLAEEPLQYSDFVAWEQEWRRGPEFAAMRSFWQTRLAGAPPLALLEASGRKSSGNRALPFSFDEELAEQITRFTVQHGVTRAAFMMTAFMALLWHRTGQEDLSVGVPLTGRNQVEAEGIFGLFYSTSVVRITVRPGASMLALLAAVREGLGDAFAHPVLPFRDLSSPNGAAISPEAPFFQVEFVCFSSHMSWMTLHEASVLNYMPYMLDDKRRQQHRQGIFLNMDASEAVFFGFWRYATDVLDEDFIMELSASYERLVRAWLETPDRTVEELCGGR